MAKDGLIRWTTVTLDCSDAEYLAAFYSDLFGWEINARDGAGWVQVRDPDGGVGQLPGRGSIRAPNMA